MYKSYLNFIIILMIFLAFSCKTQAPVAQEINQTSQTKIQFHHEDTSTVGSNHPAATRINDLIHSSLKLEPDWNNHFLNGQATLILKPYFYPVEKLQLDAKGFDLHRVAMISDQDTIDLNYQYDDRKVLNIDLGQIFNRNDRYTIFINYTAKPGSLDSIGLTGNDEKGIYFINADGANRDIPRQFWTQNETEFASCWFPTIDRPNERFTSEIYVTVDDYLTTLSNGILQGSENHENGLKTDHWVMNMELPAYLVLMVASDFAVVRDDWHGKEVSYYVDQKYKQYARDIFGRTPQMIDFFSQILDEPYPWPKYAQAVVHNFVSGAMENTSATIHFEGLQQTRREMLDGNNEDYISHELFHQWFGDLVTCESWANISLNESFATYGEYLWIEHADGRMEADEHLNHDLTAYLSESEHKQKALIRYEYGSPDELFDAHSYQKGGRILHMLRKYLGDDAFFGGLHLYLEQNKYQPVEWTQLRLAMETVSGFDLNWFFNQWFLTPGHPVLDITYHYDQVKDSTLVSIRQHSSMHNDYIYRLPLKIDVYRGNNKKRIAVELNDSIEILAFQGKPDLINIDAEKMLLCEKTDHKTEETWIYQFRHAPLFIDKIEALDTLFIIQSKIGKPVPVFYEALNESYRGLRIAGLKDLIMDKNTSAKILNKVKSMAVSDIDAGVRNAAYGRLSELNDPVLNGFFIRGLQDSSYDVESTCLIALYHIDSLKAYQLSTSFEHSLSGNILTSVAFIYSKMGEVDKNDFFVSAIEQNHGWSAFSLYAYYGKYLNRQFDPALFDKSIHQLDHLLSMNPSWMTRYGVLSVLATEQKRLEILLKDADDDQKGKLSELIDQVTAILDKMGG